MQKDTDRQAIHAPSVMTAEFFSPDGQRYNFEETVIEEGMIITLVNDTGYSTVLKFWNSRQSQRNFPLDRDAEAADQRKKRSRLFTIYARLRWLLGMDKPKDRDNNAR